MVKPSLTVVSYDETNDTFQCTLTSENFDAANDHEVAVEIDAAVLPYVVGHFGEPNDFISTTYELAEPRFAK